MITYPSMETLHPAMSQSRNSYPCLFLLVLVLQVHGLGRSVAVSCSGQSFPCPTARDQKQMDNERSNHPTSL